MSGVTGASDKVIEKTTQVITIKTKEIKALGITFIMTKRIPTNSGD